eukprot:scaffold3181_cov389-Prasinococcus_capsulatus_cf.AAC.6
MLLPRPWTQSLPCVREHCTDARQGPLQWVHAANLSTWHHRSMALRLSKCARVAERGSVGKMGRQ